MLRAVLVSLCFAAFATAATAETVCSNGAARRVVSVEPAARASLPCAVRYVKEPENLDQVLWNAQQDRRYCEDKAAELVGRLREAGWDCQDEEAGREATPRIETVRARTLPAVAAPPPSPAGPPEPVPPPSAQPPVRPGEGAGAPRVAARTAPPAVAQIEAPPPDLRGQALPLRERIVLDPRMRFYRSSFGDDAVREALRLVPVDLNEDGREELFLQVALPALCGDGPCTWDLFELRADGSLGSLGIRQVIDWRTLRHRSGGFPDLAVRFARGGDAEYGVFRYELGMYRGLDQSVSAEIFAADAPPPVSAP